MSPEEGYDLHAKDYDQRRDYLNSFEKDELKRLIGDVKGKKVLDVGCGTGRLIGYLQNEGAEVTGVDLSEKMVEKVQKKFSFIDVKQADIRELPFENDSFDVVIAAFVIVHLKDLQEAFDEVCRVLKPGGHFIVTNINQRKAPKIKTDEGEIVIESYYHIPRHVAEAMQESFFEIEEEGFVEENGIWVNHILKGRKL